MCRFPAATLFDTKPLTSCEMALLAKCARPVRQPSPISMGTKDPPFPRRNFFCILLATLTRCDNQTSASDTYASVGTPARSLEGADSFAHVNEFDENGAKTAL
jgi:hypothetical protein